MSGSNRYDDRMIAPPYLVSRAKLLYIQPTTATFDEKRMLKAHTPFRLLLTLIVSVIIFSSCAKQIPPEQKQADQILSKARDAFQRKLYHESRTMLWQAYELDQKLGRVPQMAEGLELLASIHALAADFDSALELRQQAIEKYRSLADRTSARALVIENALLHRQMGEERACYLMLTEALRLARVFKEQEGVRQIQWTLIPSLRDLNYVEEEAATLAELLNASLAVNDVGQQARVHKEAGISALHRNETQISEEALLRALTLAGQVGDSLLAIDVLHFLARSYTSAGKTKDAFDAYTEALRRTDAMRGVERQRAEMLTRVGNIYLRNGGFADAARFYRSALSGAIATGNKLLEGYLFVQLGHCDANTRTGMEEALKSYSSALDLFRGVSNGRGETYALISLGRLDQRRNRVSDAMQSFKQAAEVGEAWITPRPPGDLLAECEQAYSDVAFGSVYEPMADLLLQLGRNEEAFWYANKTNERRLHESLAQLEPRLSDSSTATFLDEWRHTRARRIGAERQLEYILQAGPREQDLFKDVVDVLDHSSTSLVGKASAVLQMNRSLDLMVRAGGMGLSEVQRLVPRDAAALMYVPTRRTLYAFLITPARTTVHVAAIERTRLTALAKQLRDQTNQRLAVEDSGDAVKRPVQRALDETIAALYAVLVRPVETEIMATPRVVIVPPAELAGVPVHALRKGPFRSHRYVAEQTLISYLPSLSALALDGMPMKADRQITGIGHPGATDWDVEYELRDIRAFYKEARLLFGQQATPASLAGDSADVLHIAAEIRFSPVAPGSAGIVFSDGKSFNSMRELPWGELFSLPAFPMVIFSNLARLEALDQATLAELFLMNHTSHVVVNGWMPTRRAKKFFGEIFYTNLLAGAAAKDAFRQVQLEMIKSEALSGPHMWGSFFLWGK